MKRANFQAYMTNEYMPALLMDIETSAEYAELQKLIADYVNENVALFVLGEKDMAEWDKYVAELDAMGVSTYVEMAQAAYDAMFK